MRALLFAALAAPLLAGITEDTTATTATTATPTTPFVPPDCPSMLGMWEQQYATTVLIVSQIDPSGGPEQVPVTFERGGYLPGSLYISTQSSRKLAADQTYLRYSDDGKDVISTSESLVGAFADVGCNVLRLTELEDG